MHIIYHAKNRMARRNRSRRWSYACANRCGSVVPPRLRAALDVLDSPEASVLVRLAAEEPFNVRQFLAACQASPYTARKTMERLERLGVIATTHTDQGAIQVASIRLTPFGRRLAEKFLEIEALIAAALYPPEPAPASAQPPVTE
jgi:DNA-binding MarR family transcriptional regulator